MRQPPPKTSGSEQGSNDPKAPWFERFAKKGKRGGKKHGKRMSKRG